MQDSIKIKTILEYLNELYPNAKCSLNYSKDYELLIAVILSAQTTDKKVNEITPILFSKYKNLDELNDAKLEDIEMIIKKLGLYKNKALAIKDVSNKLINEFNYKVPSNKKDLLSFKGVGNKVANVVLIELFNVPEFPVDTHIYRFSKRLGFINENESIEKAEKSLKNLFPKDSWIKLHHQIIFFGRYKCMSKNPNCIDCKIKKYCEFNKD